MPPKPPLTPPGGPKDPALARYLEGLDLDSVDLEELDLEALDPALPPVAVAGPGEGVWRLLGGLGLSLLALPLQATDTYQLHGQPWWLAALVVAGLAVVGVDGLMALIAGVQRLRGLSHAPTEDGAGAGGSPASAPGWRRWAMLAAGLSLVLILWATAPQAPFGPQHGSMGWLASVVVAVAAGLVLSRWLIMQGEHDRARAALLPPRGEWRLPSWVKWASLALLAAGGVAAWAGLGVGDGPSGNFARTFLGFAVGLGSAIWLANRVDEGERARKDRGAAERR